MRKINFLGIFFIWILLHSIGFSNERRFVTENHIIIDLEKKIEWLRCSVGQRWDGSKCMGEIVNLSLEMVPMAIKIANEQLGGDWRLPSKVELTSIVCKQCPSPKINKENKQDIYSKKKNIKEKRKKKENKNDNINLT